MFKGLIFIFDKKQSRSDMVKYGYSVFICSIIIYIIMYGNDDVGVGIGCSNFI